MKYTNRPSDNRHIVVDIYTSTNSCVNIYSIEFCSIDILIKVNLHNLFS